MPRTARRVDKRIPARRRWRMSLPASCARSFRTNDGIAYPYERRTGSGGEIPQCPARTDSPTRDSIRKADRPIMSAAPTRAGRLRPSQAALSAKNAGLTATDASHAEVDVWLRRRDRVRGPDDQRNHVCRERHWLIRRSIRGRLPAGVSGRGTGARRVDSRQRGCARRSSSAIRTDGSTHWTRTEGPGSSKSTSPRLTGSIACRTASRSFRRRRGETRSIVPHICTFRGISSRRIGNGSVVWKTYMVDAEKDERLNRTATFGPSGAGVDRRTVDAARGVLYITTGDSYSRPAAAVRSWPRSDGPIVWSREPRRMMSTTRHAAAGDGVPESGPIRLRRRCWCGRRTAGRPVAGQVRRRMHSIRERSCSGRVGRAAPMAAFSGMSDGLVYASVSGVACGADGLAVGDARLIRCGAAD